MEYDTKCETVTDCNGVQQDDNNGGGNSGGANSGGALDFYGVPAPPISVSTEYRVSVQGVKSLGGHFVCLCRGFEFSEVKKNFCYYIFQNKKWKYFYILIIFIVKSLQKQQNSKNLLL